ncbi:MAG: hypothetical protein ABIR66_02500 [Saprospiraceae bacterium]
MSTRVNLADGRGNGEFGIKLIGTDGVLDIVWNTFTLNTLKRNVAPGYDGYDSFDSFSTKQKEEFKKWYKDKLADAQGGYELGKTTEYAPPDNYDDRVDHLITFFNGIRSGTPILEDPTFGLRAAAPSITCNISAATKKVLKWDAVKMLLS